MKRYDTQIAHSRISLQLNIHIDRREGRRYYAYSEDLPGVYGLGKSIEEAKKSILQAMRLYIQHCRKKGKPVPAARTV